MANFTYRLCDLVRDFQDVVDVLMSTQTDLYLPDRAAAEKVAGRCFAQGNVLGGFHEGLLCGALGFFYGEPRFDFVNKEILFLYVGAIRPDYQRSRLFFQGLYFVMQQAQMEGRLGFRLQAAADNRYTCRLYGRFADPLREEKSPRGVSAITFGATLDEGLARLARYQKRPFAQSSQTLPTA